MKSKKILIFDISSEFGHYRKFNTTTSPLTYPIPTRTSIAGLLGAIVGQYIDRYNFYSYFSKKDTGIAIQVINPVKKINIGFNLINTKESFYNISSKGKTRVGYELLQNPKFRIFYSSDNDNLFTEIEQRIKENNHYFTPYLGLSQFTAKVDYIDTIVGEEINNSDYIEIITAINMKNCSGEKSIKFDYEKKYSVNVMPIEMELDSEKDRIVTEYSDVIIEITGKSIISKVNSYLKTVYGNIIYL
jgi:CRISPR-associated protein Cas5h